MPEKRQVGETFEIGTVAYTIKGKQVRSQLTVAGTIVPAGRGAMFVLIDYNVANRGPDSITVNPTDLLLVTADRTEYDVDLPATYALRMENTLTGSSASSALLRARQSGAYTAVFVVADDVARGTFNIVIRHRASVAIE